MKDFQDILDSRFEKFLAPARKNPPATWMDTLQRLVSFHRSLCQTCAKSPENEK